MEEKSASQQIDAIIKKYDGWKGQILKQIRSIILEADPEITEETKWKMATRPEGWPVWSHNGIVCFAEVWKDNVKLLLPKGAHLVDVNKTFNARLESKDIRAIEYKEGDTIKTVELRELMLNAIKLNNIN